MRALTGLRRTGCQTCDVVSDIVTRSALATATATLLVACGSIPSQGGGLATTSSVPSQISNTPSPTAAGWVTYANHDGRFTFSAPSEWQVQSCEDANGDYVVTTHNGTAPCGRGEYYDGWLFAVSLAGDQRQKLPPNGSGYFYVGTPTGNSDVVVDGVHGNRYTAHVDKSNPLPPPSGTNQIYYVVYNGIRTYAFEYSQWPTDPDRSADFDRLVQQTLRMSA